MTNAIILILTILEVLTALLLIGIILLQQSKAGGGLGAVGGGVTESVFGATAGNVLTRGTVILATMFFVVTLVLAIITGQRGPGKSVADGLAAEPDVVEETAKSGDEAATPIVADEEKADETTGKATEEKAGAEKAVVSTSEDAAGKTVEKDAPAESDAETSKPAPPPQ